MKNPTTPPPVLAIAIPCLNEEECIHETTKSLIAVLADLVEKGLIHRNSFIGYIDDGSTDNTWEIINDFKRESAPVQGVKLSSNFGHQNALLAGLMTFKTHADCIISMDADLQDDIHVIENMVQCFLDGYEVVYGIRQNRKNDTFLKKTTAELFYKFSKFIGIKLIFNHADYRLSSRRVLEALNGYQEVNLFLRGLFPLMGFKNTCVKYKRIPRTKGQSKFPLRRMISFALDGITSFSVMPLRWITITGFAIFTFSIMMSIYALYSYVFLGAVHGWASIVLPSYLLGGIQILSIGIIGEYLGKIYKETKRRPSYLIENSTLEDPAGV